MCLMTPKKLKGQYILNIFRRQIVTPHHDHQPPPHTHTRACTHIHHAINMTKKKHVLHICLSEVKEDELTGLLQAYAERVVQGPSQELIVSRKSPWLTTWQNFRKHRVQNRGLVKVTVSDLLCSIQQKIVLLSCYMAGN